MKRCINCKKDIIPMGEKLFEGFHSIFPPKEFAQACYFVLSDGKTGPYFPFAQRSEKGSFWHLRVERGFWEEQIHLRINDVFVSYLQYGWETAMCTYKVLNNSRYGRLSSISKQYVVCSPWFVSENTKEGLDDALHQLGAWYQEHLAEIHLSYEKQQTWLDKQWGSDKITRLYLDDHLSELTQDDIFELYRMVDRLAAEYQALDPENQTNPLGIRPPFGGFGAFCYGKLPPVINRWIEEISESIFSKQVVKDIDRSYARSFALTAFLYLFHDSQKSAYPAILKREELWK